MSVLTLNDIPTTTNHFISSHLIPDFMSSIALAKSALLPLILIRANQAVESTSSSKMHLGSPTKNDSDDLRARNLKMSSECPLQKSKFFLSK